MRPINTSAPHTRTHRHCPRGFAIITAVAMIALVAACFVMLAEVFYYQLKFTNTTIARLQVDLLLNAGTKCVMADLADGVIPIKPWDMVLPKSLVNKAGRVSITPRHQGVNTILFVTVNARFSGLQALRVLEFQAHGGHWKLIKVTIPGSRFGNAAF